MWLLACVAVDTALLAVVAATSALPFTEQLRIAARVQSGTRGPDLTFVVSDSHRPPKDHEHVLKPADVALGPRPGWIVKAGHVGAYQSKLFNLKDLGSLPRNNATMATTLLKLRSVLARTRSRRSSGLMGHLLGFRSAAGRLASVRAHRPGAAARWQCRRRA